MPARSRKRRSIPLEHFDVGPAIRRERGDVMVLDAADPDAPNRTIRRAKVVWCPDALLAEGSIGQHHHDAATRYVVSYERGILGAQDRHSTAGVRAPRMAPTGLPIGRLMAASDYADAERAVGITLSPALAWCVLSTGSLTGWAECKGWDRRRASGYLLAALDRLAEHYGYS